MTLMFSALESDLYEAENLIHVTTMQLSNDLSHMHHNFHMLPSVGNGNLFTVDPFRLSNVILGG